LVGISLRLGVDHTRNWLILSKGRQQKNIMVNRETSSGGGGAVER